MRNILARTQRPLLTRFARADVLLAFDYDGTLAPIVKHPREARMRRSTRALLARLAKLYRVIVISGRARADVRARLAGVGVREVFGNHGIEPRHAAPRHAARVRRWVSALETSTSALPGVSVEDKTYSVTIHYRRAPRKRAARAAIHAAASALGQARVVGGKQVVNLVPHGAPHKGLALAHERERLGCEAAVYVGDDETDEDAFALGRGGWLLPIRVGSKRGSAATHFVPGQGAVDDLLRLLIGLHAAALTGTGRRRRHPPRRSRPAPRARSGAAS